MSFWSLPSAFMDYARGRERVSEFRGLSYHYPLGSRGKTKTHSFLEERGFPKFARFFPPGCQEEENETHAADPGVAACSSLKERQADFIRNGL